MSDILTRYKAVDYALPESYLSWDLFGAGLENLGRGGKPIELPLRNPNSDEVLLRVDALGLCFSDTKLIWAGPEHPRIRGRDLANDPTVAGHEAALTVVRVGDDWKNKFEVGQRFIVQADIYINGEQKAYGYVQRGAMAQYTYVGPWVLDGDAGCYLLPLKDSTGYAEAALVEPWACVEAAYRIPVRQQPRSGGSLLVIFNRDLPVDFEGMYTTPPGKVAILGRTSTDLTAILADTGVVKGCAPTPETVTGLARDETGGQGFDDILLIGDCSAELVTACDAALARDGVMVFLCQDRGVRASLDIGRVHYHGTRHVGSTAGKVMDAYQANIRAGLKPGGRSWMIGAAGPMGQMHVQRALELDEPPAVLLGTDISAQRLAYMQSRLAALAGRKGVKFSGVDVSKPEALEQALSEAAGADGFDDICVLAPVAALVEQAAEQVGPDAVLNVFAGVGLGTMAVLDSRIFSHKHARVIGSSGSSMDDIKSVLEQMEAGKLATRMSLAALGGIETTWEGIKGVKENRFPGKTVIYPQLTGLPLVEPDKLQATCPQAAANLENGNIWTNRAEDALLETRLAL